MTKSKVRCWRVENWRGIAEPDVLHISYPEDNSGFDLISCLKCGHVYSASVSKAVYVGPELQEKLKGMRCISCNSPLYESVAPYPNKYLADNVIVEFQRPVEMPSDEDSVVLEFDEIYS